MVKVFISYAHEDQDSATRLYRELKAVNGIEPWFDKESLGPGMRWKPAIRKNIRESDFFVALLSKKSGSRRGFVHSELNTALEVLKEFPEGQIYLIPVRLDDCQMPVDELTEIQYVDLFPDWGSGIAKVLKSIGTKTSIESRNIDLLEKKIAIASDKKSDSIDSVLNKKPDPDYEYRVGIIDLDSGLTNLNRIAGHLNSIQRYFRFVCPTIQAPENTIKLIGGFSNFVVDLLPLSFYEERQYVDVDLVACLTKYPLAFYENEGLVFNYFSGPANNDERFMFLSLSQLDDYTKSAKVTLEKGIAYLIASQLVVYFTQLGFHTATRGCLMDFCRNRADIIQGLTERRFCSWCEPNIKNKAFKQSIESILKSDFRI